MLKRLSSVIMFSFLLFGLLVLIPSAQPLKTCRAEYAFPSGQEDTRLAKNKTSDHDEKGILQPDITEHIITASELGKLKQEIGIWQEGKNYNQIVDGHGTGLCPPTEKEWAEIGSKTCMVDRIKMATTTTQFPSSVDHTKGPWFPPIGDQGSQGSCVAWAVGYYTKTFQEAKEHNWYLSGATLDKIISPSFIYNLINYGVDGGSWYGDAIQLVCSVGTSSLGKMPYNPADYTSWPSEEAWREAPLYRGDDSGINFIMLQSDADLTNLKEWLASGNLAIVSVDAHKIQDQTWGWSLLDGNDMLTIDNYINPSPNHAGTIVGYDDNFAYKEQGQTRYGAFKIANSWGIPWLPSPFGWEHILDGCYWISYEAMKQRVGDCMFYHDRVDYTPKLVAAFRISHGKRGECDITVGAGNVTNPIVTKTFSDYIHGGNKPFCSNNILFDITEFKDTIPNVSNKTFFLKVHDGDSSTTGVITKFAIESVQSRDTPIYTTNGNSVFVNVTMPPSWTSLRGVYCERAYDKLVFGVSWSNMSDSSSWSGIVMKASNSSANDGCLYGPYITAGWDGESILGKPYTAMFRLKVSSNVTTSVIGYLDIGYNAGPTLQSRQIRASDFASSNTWQNIELTFITPRSLTAGLEFRVVNYNNGVTNLYVDYIAVYRGWNASTVYAEAAYNKPKIAYGNPVSWSMLVDASSRSGIVLKASASNASGSWLYGPYISSTWDGENMRGKPYVASFRLKVLSNLQSSDVAYVDVSSSTLGSVLQSKVIRASDLAAPSGWQDFNLTFIVPDLLVSGIEFRVENLNNGVTDLYVDRIAVYRRWNASTAYVEAAYNKPKIAYGTPLSWSKLVDASSNSGIVLKASASSASGSWLYGPYIKTGLDGQSLLGKSFKAAFRLKVLSNLRTDNVAYIDVSCEQGKVILDSKKVRASDFAASDTWQDFQLTFTVPSSLTYGLEFRMVNLNSGITDVSVDTITIKTM